MKLDQLRQITGKYGRLKAAVIGDFCLDRYMEIDPSRQEISIETGLPVHNVINVRSQPGGAGTILNNLVALDVAEVYPIGFAGDDGEGYELSRALQQRARVNMEFFFRCPDRRTFTYAKPLLIKPGAAPVELSRLDTKNWTPTPRDLQELICRSVRAAAEKVDLLILLDQVDVEETGVVTRSVLQTIQTIGEAKPEIFIIADSRRGLREFPPVSFKMNLAELAFLTGADATGPIEGVKSLAATLARTSARHVFVTLAEQGIVGATRGGATEHVPSLPLRGEIDIVGAGDSVTANLACALAAGATLREALEIAMLAASLVIHQLGTTGTASPRQIEDLYLLSARSGPWLPSKLL